MRTSYRIATTTVALAAVFPFGMGSAHADSGTETASAAAYFSDTTPQKTAEMPADPGPNFVALGTDGVAPGELGVAVITPNKSEKESFLRFDLLKVPLGATITSAVVTAPLSEDPTSRPVSPDPAKVAACAVGPQGWADGVDAGAYNEKPAADCAKMKVAAKASADGKSYTFDITPLASTWMTDLNEGVALVPSVTSQPFQVVFKKREFHTIALTWTPPVVIPDDPGDVTTVPQPPVNDYVPPVNTGTVTGPTVVTQPVPAPVPAPAPKVPVTAARPLVRTAGAGLVENTSPSAAFWLAALEGVVLLGTVSLILGDTRVPVRSAGMQNGVGRALDVQRRTRSRTGLGHAARPVRTA